LDSIGASSQPLLAQQFDGGQPLVRCAAQPEIPVGRLLMQRDTPDDFFHRGILPRAS